jgi:hypothetical protein
MKCVVCKTKVEKHGFCSEDCRDVYWPPKKTHMSFKQKLAEMKTWKPTRTDLDEEEREIQQIFAT